MERHDVADATHILVDKKQPVRDGGEPGQETVPKDTAPVYANCQLGRLHSHLRDKSLGVFLKDDLA